MKPRDPWKLWKCTVPRMAVTGKYKSNSRPGTINKEQVQSKLMHILWTPESCKDTRKNWKQDEKQVLDPI